MRKLLIGLIILLLSACSTQGSGGSSKPSEFESSMQEAYDMLSAGFDEDNRELTRKQKDRLSYLLYSKEHDIEMGTEDYDFYQALQKYQTHYSGYQTGTIEYVDLIEAKESADKYFK
jgi:hypothetical protein